MYNDYGVFGEIELWNNNRTGAYVRNGISDGQFRINSSKCADIPLIVDPDSDSYISPASDPAPWYDAAYPESADAAGVWVMSVDGFDTGGSRSVSSTAFGSVAGPKILDPKTITVTAWLIAKDCCAAQYLYRWLVATLARKDCTTGLEASELRMYDCCPDGMTLEEAEEAYLRSMFEVKVAKDPIILDRLGSCCGTDCLGSNLQVQWTFVLQNPKLYKEIDFCLTDGAWPGTTECVDWDCEPCAVDPTVSVEVSREKIRYGAKVLANRTWCPVGDWEPSDHFDNPDESYIEIVNTDIQENPFNIYITYDGVWSGYTWQTPFPDLRTINLCNLNIQIANYVTNPASPGFTYLNGAFQDASPEQTAVLPIRLNATSAFGGLWTPVGWTLDPNMPYPPPGTKFVIDNGCGCASHDTNCEIVLDEGGSWSPMFDYIGTFPPLGCSGVSLYGQVPGEYITTETVSLENAFSGLPEGQLVLADSYSSVQTGYCQPAEWKRQCCRIDLDNIIEGTQPYIEFSSGSAALYNFSAQIYKLTSADDPCLCDPGITAEEIAAFECRTPDYSLNVGRMIPASSVWRYDPRRNVIEGDISGTVQNASGITSGQNGSSPYFIDMSDCSGYCVVVTAEVRRDGGGTIISPAANSTVDVGYVRFSPVGV